MAHINIILWNNTILFYKNPAIQVGKIISFTDEEIEALGG